MNYPLVASVDEHPYELGKKAIYTLITLLDMKDEKRLHIKEDCRPQLFIKKKKKNQE